MDVATKKAVINENDKLKRQFNAFTKKYQSIYPDFNSESVREKFRNISGKTAQGYVSDELFQNRTPRTNRVYITWQEVFSNQLTIEALNTFEGGVAVAFINNDFFDEEKYKDNPTFRELKDYRLGSDENVSAIISITTEAGSPSSQTQRTAFKNLLNNTSLYYAKEKRFVVINKDNFENFIIYRDSEIMKQKEKEHTVGVGNEGWKGCLHINIQGGDQDSILYPSTNQILFNPGCEYASAITRSDIDLVLEYFFLLSFDEDKLGSLLQEYKILKNSFEVQLSTRVYDLEEFKGNLLNYCNSHPSVICGNGKLYDAIQCIPIEPENFATQTRIEKSIDLTHNEAVVYHKYYWDSIHGCVLSPARPTNLFWSYHLSNMLQQNDSLASYFEKEINRIEKRINLGLEKSVKIVRN